MFQHTYVQIAKKNLYRKLNKALYNWGKALHPHYHVFQPIVEMGLLIVEQNAHEKFELPCVGDYQRSVYQVFEEAVKAAAAPQVGDISALANVGTKPIPCTWYPYYILYQRCILRTSVNQLARRLHLGPRTLARIRSTAIEEITEKIYRWEMVARIKDCLVKDIQQLAEAQRQDLYTVNRPYEEVCKDFVFKNFQTQRVASANQGNEIVEKYQAFVEYTRADGNGSWRSEGMSYQVEEKENGEFVIIHHPRHTPP